MSSSIAIAKLRFSTFRSEFEKLHAYGDRSGPSKTNSASANVLYALASDHGVTVTDEMCVSRGKSRRSYLRWHAKVVQPNEGDSWRQRLRGAKGGDGVRVSDTWISNLVTENSETKSGYKSDGTKQLGELGRLEDDSFFDKLLGPSKRERLDGDSNLPDKPSFKAFIEAKNVEDWADACSQWGLDLVADYRASLIERHKKKALREPGRWRRSHIKVQIVAPYGLSSPEANEESRVPLHTVEHDALAKIAAALLRGKVNERSSLPAGVLIIAAEPHAGTGYLLDHLIGQLRTTDKRQSVRGTRTQRRKVIEELAPFARVLHVYVDSITDPTKVRAAIFDALEADGENNLPRVENNVGRVAEIIAGLLIKGRRLLIVHGASACKTHGWETLNRIAAQLIALGSRFIRLVVTDWSGKLHLVVGFHKTHRSNCLIAFRPMLDPTQTLPYFEIALDHYATHRKPIGTDDEAAKRRVREGTLFKRVAHLYGGSARHTQERISGIGGKDTPKGKAKKGASTEDRYKDYPAAVRWRALLSSNPIAPSPFDPTKGVRRMIADALGTNAANRPSGPEALDPVPEMAFVIGDVVSAIRDWDPKGNDTALRALRLISTSLWWLSSDMVRALARRSETESYAGGVDLQHVTVQPFATYDFLGDAPRHSDVDEEVNTPRLRVRTPLILRSILQEDWLHFDATGRMAVHNAISKELEARAADATGGNLADELPMAPPRGQVRTVLIVESIRHAMAAARSAQDLGLEEAKAFRLRARQLYESVLDRRSFLAVPEPAKDVLAASADLHPDLPRNHGLFGLKLEVLALMSPDGGLSAPIDFTHEEASAFHRERGICLTRELRPVEAIDAFRAALEGPHLSVEAKAYIIAHRITAEIEAGDLLEAEKSFNELESLEKARTISHEVRKAMSHRRTAREAALLLAQSRPDMAMEVWSSIEEPGLVPYRSVRAVQVLDTMIALQQQTQENLIRSWVVAERAHKAALEAGLDFEAIEIDIRKARLLCGISRFMVEVDGHHQKGLAEVAEACLDHVGLDLGTHGGSQMCYQNWLAESARTLQVLGRPGYAFATYAWPSFQALRDSQARPRAETARKLCLELLQEVRAMQDKGEQEEWQPISKSRFWQASKYNDSRLVDPWFSFDLHPPEEDVERLFIELWSSEGKLNALWSEVEGARFANTVAPRS
jgi:hypothetical protein